MDVPKGQVAYEPNSLAMDGPRESPERGFVSVAEENPGGKRREPIRAVREDQAVRWARCVREELSYRRVRIGAVGFELTNAIVEGKASCLDATEHHRGGEHLRQPVEIERRVGSGGDGPLDVLPPKRLFPDNVVGPHDGGSKTRYAGLNAKRFDVVAETTQHKLLRLHGQAASNRR
jgi:hypothetical protein